LVTGESDGPRHTVNPQPKNDAESGSPSVIGGTDPEAIEQVETFKQPGSPWAPASRLPQSAAPGQETASGVKPHDAGQPSLAASTLTAPSSDTFESSVSDKPAQPKTHEQFLSVLFSARQLAMNATPMLRFWGWFGPLLVALVGGVVRFIRLGVPPSLVFDETYYVKGAYTLLRVGYEADWPDDINDTWNAGNLDVFLDKADYVVHPPLGKWMIAFGMWIGDPHNAATWRLSTAIVSVIAIFLIARVVRSMTGSLTAGLVAGGLFAIDGVAIVHARTGLLDSFLMFWVLVAFALLVKDREFRRRRLAQRAADRLAAGLDLRWGPGLGWSWWRFAAAFALGLSCGIKWSGLYYVAAFCLMAVIWDWGARRAIGVKHWFWDGFWRDGVVSALIMLPTALVAYLAAWSTWFIHGNAYGRNWFLQNPGSYPSWFPDWAVESGEGVRSLWHYHTQMMGFHTGLSSEHKYEASPWGWLLQIRPTSFYWDKTTDGSVDCGASECAAAITSIGNPLIWWLATAALVFLVYRVARHGDWIAGAIVTGVLAGWLPWLFFPERTIFTFYVIAFAPFMCMALAYAAYVIWQRYENDPVAAKRVRHTFIIVGVVIVTISVFFYPIWTAIPVPYWFWRAHMWLPSSWI
jgi:dolichyl-phosphate-mannose--protein O-mannosyl transferase